MTGEAVMGDAALSDAFSGLERGYCLWVGAGLTRQVAGSKRGPPLWRELTVELEHEAGLNGHELADFPTRLERCVTILGAPAFRAFLRRRYWTDLCVTLLAEADELLDADDDRYHPERLGAIGALAQLANPIVNFNIEWLSSVLLARPCGPFQLAVDNPALSWREPSSRFQRRVQHPHGLADTTTVMTNSEYGALEHSLAFGVAIHGAFNNQLAIVGMSLDDKYLRHQIEEHRQSIGRIYWFNDDFPSALAAWAGRHEITMVEAAWPDFWATCATLPVDIDPVDIAAAWYIAVDVATEEAEGGPLNGPLRSVAGLDECPPSLRRLAERAATRANETGEPNEPRLVHDKSARSIELRLRQKLIAEGVPLPLRQKEF